MTTRVLPPEEYQKLAGTDAAELVPYLTDASRVLVVEHGDRVVGCWVAMPVVHLHVECLYIALEHRNKSSVARRLWVGMKRLLRDEYDTSAVMTAAVSDEVKGLLAHVGATKVPGDHYVMSFGG